MILLHPPYSQGLIGWYGPYYYNLMQACHHRHHKYIITIWVWSSVIDDVVWFVFVHMCLFIYSFSCLCTYMFNMFMCTCIDAYLALLSYVQLYTYMYIVNKPKRKRIIMYRYSAPPYICECVRVSMRRSNVYICNYSPIFKSVSTPTYSLYMN
jgi:hypothetical protein